MLNFDSLSGVSQENAKLIFLILFALIGVVVLFIPNDYIFKGLKKEEQHWYTNLKFWAIGCLTILAFIYYMF